jgi:predicted esterase
MRHPVIIIAVSAALCIAPATFAAKEGPVPDASAGPEPFPTGQVIERVTCAADPERSYALYLPSNYRPDREWPILILMDPRGRALVPMVLFREAVERNGYIVASSYDTRSDTPQPVNRIAMRAMLPDLEARFSLDLRRYYLAGFSGTARAAWGFGSVLGDRVAGVIGVGAGHPPDYQMVGRMPFVFFGTAGTGDFNYDEMRALDEVLDPSGTPHRFEFFDGAHQWPDASLCGRAVDWMELQAMRAGLCDRDVALLESLHAAMMSEARRLEAADGQYEAWVRYRTIVEDFSGLRDTTEALERVEVLGRLDAVRLTEARHAEIALEHAAYQNRLMSFLAGLHGPGRPPPLSRTLRILQINDLRRRMEATDDPIGAAAARRWLEHAYVLISFYVPRDRLDENEPEFSLAALQIAAAIKPKNARICLGEARAYAQMGKVRKALRGLECALESGRITPAQLEADPYLEPLHSEDGYRALVERPQNSP